MSLYSYFIPKTRRQATLSFVTTIGIAFLLVAGFIFLFGTRLIDVENSGSEWALALIGYAFVALFALTVYFLVEIVRFSIHGVRGARDERTSNDHVISASETPLQQLQHISYDPSQQPGAVKTLSLFQKNIVALVSCLLFVVFIVLLAQGKVAKEAVGVLAPLVFIALMLLSRAKGVNQKGTPQMRKEEFALRNNFSYSAPSATGSHVRGERELGIVSGELNARSFTIRFTQFRKPLGRFTYEYAHVTVPVPHGREATAAEYARSRSVLVKSVESGNGEITFTFMSYEEFSPSDIQQLFKTIDEMTRFE